MAHLKIYKHYEPFCKQCFYNRTPAHLCESYTNLFLYHSPHSCHPLLKFLARVHPCLQKAESKVNKISSFRVVGGGDGKIILNHDSTLCNFSHPALLLRTRLLFCAFSAKNGENVQDQVGICTKHKASDDLRLMQVNKIFCSHICFGLSTFGAVQQKVSNRTYTCDIIVV